MAACEEENQSKNMPLLSNAVGSNVMYARFVVNGL